MNLSIFGLMTHLKLKYSFLVFPSIHAMKMDEMY